MFPKHLGGVSCCCRHWRSDRHRHSCLRAAHTPVRVRLEVIKYLLAHPELRDSKSWGLVGEGEKRERSSSLLVHYLRVSGSLGSISAAVNHIGVLWTSAFAFRQFWSHPPYFPPSSFLSGFTILRVFLSTLAKRGSLEGRVVILRGEAHASSAGRPFHPRTLSTTGLTSFLPDPDPCL